MRVFLQAIVAQLLLNPYIYWRGRQALPQKKGIQWTFAGLFLLEWLIYFTGFFFHNELPDTIMTPILHICGAWYIASIYITLTLLTLEVIRLTDKWWHWFPQGVYLNLPTIKRVLFVVIAVGAVALLFRANYKVNHPIVKHVYLTVPKETPGRDSLRIVLMSDLHIGEMIGKELVQKYVRLSNSQHPDMVVLAGDIMDYESRFAENAHIEEDLRQLQAPLGTYIVYGNHEYRANRMAKQKWLKTTGGILLVDSLVQPDSTFYLVGRDDYINKLRKPLHAIVEGINSQKPLIVIDHQPVAFTEMTMNGVDLGLHGHTHNGQYWPYSLLLKLVFECPYGSYQKGGTQFYISSGIGIAGPPYRVGTDSEMIVLHIQFKKPTR